MKIISNSNHSHFIDDLATVELGSIIFNIDENKMYIMLEPGILTEITTKNISVETLEALTEAIAAGGKIEVAASIDAPTGFIITVDTTIVNNGEITIKEDIVGDGVFTVTDGTLILNGKGIINGLGINDWSMAVQAKENGKVIINDGYFTNVGAESANDSEHFDLIYASVNSQVEITCVEFKC